MELVQLIRDEILSLPGPEARIRESDLMEKYAVSRSSVREALKQLEVEKLIVRTRNRGTTLRRFSLKEISDIYDLRAGLEGLAAGFAARHISRENAERLRALAKRCDTPEEDSEIRHRREEEFHRMILKEANNAHLCELVEGFAILRRGFEMYLRKSRVPRWREQSYDAPWSHVGIAEAIAAGDADRAERLMRTHVTKAKQQLIEEFIESDGA